MRLTYFLTQISAWKLRGNLPHAVESTWLLNEACLTDESATGHTSLFAVKAAYITAISRYISIMEDAAHLLTHDSFVTGLLDSQQDSKYKVSMYAKAQEIGLPALFVDLRHEATHGDMPSLTNLRRAALQALRWLWDDYWKVLGDWKDREMERSVQEEADTERSFDAVPPIQTDVPFDTTVGFTQRAESDLDSQSISWTKWQRHWLSAPIGSVKIINTI